MNHQSSLSPRGSSGNATTPHPTPPQDVRLVQNSAHRKCSIFSSIISITSSIHEFQGVWTQSFVTSSCCIICMIRVGLLCRDTHIHVGHQRSWRIKFCYLNLRPRILRVHDKDIHSVVTVSRGEKSQKILTADTHTQTQMSDID